MSAYAALLRLRESFLLNILFPFFCFLLFSFFFFFFFFFCLFCALRRAAERDTRPSAATPRRQLWRNSVRSEELALRARKRYRALPLPPTPPPPKRSGEKITNASRYHLPGVNSFFFLQLHLRLLLRPRPSAPAALWQEFKGRRVIARAGSLIDR